MRAYSFVLPALALVLTAPANAWPVSVSVDYGDLDLAREKGVTRLDRRIAAAIDELCGDERDQLERSAVRAVRRCSRDVWPDVATQRQLAIERARVRTPTVEVVGGRSATFLIVRRH